MAAFTGTRIDWHADHRHREHSEMNNHSHGIKNVLRIVAVGVALSLAGSQAIAAESNRPNADAGGPGGAGSDSAEVYYELEHEQGRPVVIEQAQSDSAELAAYQRAQVWPNFDEADTVVQQPDTSMLEGGPYAVAGSDGPNLGTTRLAEATTSSNASASEGGYYAVVDEHGNEFVPEQAASADEPQPDFAVHQNLRSIQLIEGKEAANAVAQPTSPSTAYVICAPCATVG